MRGDKPSDYFLGAILRGYDKEAAAGREVTPSAIWGHICMECITGQRGSFMAMFAWDTSKARNINRIGTIRDTIAAGHVPGLRLGTNAKGREVVEPC